MQYDVSYPRFEGDLLSVPMERPWYTYPETALPSIALMEDGGLRQFEDERFSPAVFFLPNTIESATEYFITLLRFFAPIEELFSVQRFEVITPDYGSKDLCFHVYWQPPSYS